MIERVTFPRGDLTPEGLLERPDGADVWGGAVLCRDANLPSSTLAKLQPLLYCLSGAIEAGPR